MKFLAPFEWVILAYVAAVSGIVVFGRAASAAIFLAYHAAAVAMILMVAYANRRYGGAFWRFVRYWLPLYVILASFREMHYLIPEVHPFEDQASDLALAELDWRLFGDVYGKVRRLWNPWFVDFLHLCYWTYFPMPITLCAALYWKGRLREARHVGTVLLATFYTGYLFYVAVPAIGPHHFEPRSPALDGAWLGGTMHKVLLQVEWKMPDAFPSLHTAVAAVTLVLAWKFSRRLFWIFLVPATGLIVATFVLRYHYFIDVVAGLAVVPITATFGGAWAGAWERLGSAENAELAEGAFLRRTEGNSRNTRSMR